MECSDFMAKPSRLVKFDPEINFHLEAELQHCLEKTRGLGDDLANLNRAGQDLLSDIGGVGLSKAATAQLDNFIQNLDGFLLTLHNYNHRMARYGLTTGYTLEYRHKTGTMPGHPKPEGR